MDKDTQATLKGVELAESLGIPMVIMEPVKGGSLAELPDDITSIFRNIRPQASTPSWALRYVATFSNVKVVLSGMSNMEQVEDNLKTFTDFEPLNEAEQEAVCQVADALHKRVKNGCTACRYCMPCPAGVNIPGSFGYGMNIISTAIWLIPNGAGRKRFQRVPNPRTASNVVSARESVHRRYISEKIW